MGAPAPTTTVISAPADVRPAQRVAVPSPALRAPHLPPETVTTVTTAQRGAQHDAAADADRRAAAHRGTAVGRAESAHRRLQRDRDQAAPRPGEHRLHRCAVAIPRPSSTCRCRGRRSVVLNPGVQTAVGRRDQHLQPTQLRGRQRRGSSRWWRRPTTRTWRPARATVRSAVSSDRVRASVGRAFAASRSKNAPS